MAEHFSSGQSVAERPLSTLRHPVAADRPTVFYTRESRRAIPPRIMPPPALVAAIAANTSHSASMLSGPVIVPYTDAFELKGTRTTATEALERARNFLTQGQLAEARQFLEGAARDFPADESLRALAKIVSRNKATPLPTKFPRRDQEFRWLKANREQYRGKWVALLGGDLIAAGDSMKEVLGAVKARQIQGAPLVHKVE